MSHAPRLVLDTNVVLSALIFTQGRVAAVREAWHDGRCRPLASQATLAELIRVLKYPKFKLSADEQRELLADYIPYCIAVRIPAKPPKPPKTPKTPKTPTCRDPFDVPFLQLALAGKADSLLTGDRDLLALADRFPCRIQTADQWLKAIGK